MSPNHQKEALAQLKSICSDCDNCELRGSCNQVVFGDGNPEARLILVGEAPGSEEDRQGIPFVGKAGQLLDKILGSVNIERDDIYITNIVKCRPPANRMPAKKEVELCLPYLKKQIQLIKPEMVVCLGALATRSMINKNAAVTKVRGQFYNVDNVLFIATFHPAALLRDPGKKVFVWEDFKLIARHYQ